MNASSLNENNSNERTNDVLTEAESHDKNPYSKILLNLHTLLKEILINFDIKEAINVYFPYRDSSREKGD